MKDAEKPSYQIASSIVVLAGVLGVGFAGIAGNPAGLVSFVVGAGLLIVGYRRLSL